MSLLLNTNNRKESEQAAKIWVFGYGSLCWNPGFEFEQAVIGHVRGYSRKFWQGNATHRGTKDQPGRVATLVEDNQDSIVNGVAFALSGEHAVPYLTKRECTLGGYDARKTTFYPIRGDPIKVIVYIATPNNNLWMGDASIGEIANQIFTSRGNSGHNIEYLLKLASFMRIHFPGNDDHHLFNLEAEILRRAEENGIDLVQFMGDGQSCIVYFQSVRSDHVARAPSRAKRKQLTVRSFQCTIQKNGKHFRCYEI